jgi:putative heme transporter
MRARWRRRKPETEPPDAERPRPEADYIEIDTSQLTGVFAAPHWLRDVGLTAWLLVGVALFLVGSVWILSLTHTIVTPVIAAGVIAAVAAPLMTWLQRHHVPRPVGAILLLLTLVLLGALVVFIVIAGITSQTGDLTSHLADAKNTIEDWATDAGVDEQTAADAKDDASSSSSEAVGALLGGLGTGIAALSSLVFFLAMTALSLIFLLADGPKIRAWGERNMGVPEPVARTISNRTLQSLRGYFLGVTLVAAFNGVVVGIGALILGVPLAGTIAIVTLLAAYVPYLGAWTAAGFSVLIALGGAGTDAAIGMVVVQLLANSVLQQLVQPLAMGAALGIHPLAVLIVTIAGGALFGAVGLILAAPVTSAITRISADLSRARAERESKAPPETPPEAAPAT